MAGGFELGEKALTAVLLPIAIVFVLLAHPMIDLIYGSQYEDAVPSLQLLGAMTVFFGINEFAAIALIARDRPFTFTRVLLGRDGAQRRHERDPDPADGRDRRGARRARCPACCWPSWASYSCAWSSDRSGCCARLPARSWPARLMAGAIVATGQRLIIGALAGGLVYVGRRWCCSSGRCSATTSTSSRGLHRRRTSARDALPEGA